MRRRDSASFIALRDCGPNATIEIITNSSSQWATTELMPVPGARVMAVNPVHHVVYVVVEDESGAHLLALTAIGTTLVLEDRRKIAEHGVCHIGVDASGRWMVMSNYPRSALQLMELDERGHPSRLFSPLPLIGSGADSIRQARAHPHFSHTNGFEAYVTDLGADCVRIVTIAPSREAGLIQTGTLRLPAGSGPRQLCRLKDGALIVLCELDSTVRYIPPPPEQQINEGCFASLITDAGTRNYPSALLLTQDTSRSFIANRGNNTIAAVGISDGEPTVIDETPAAYEWPEDMALAEPWLAVTCRSGIAILDTSRRLDNAEAALLKCIAPARIEAIPWDWNNLVGEGDRECR